MRKIIADQLFGMPSACYRKTGSYEKHTDRFFSEFLKILTFTKNVVYF